VLLESFLTALQENLRNFSKQPADQQWNLANLIWEHDPKHHQHKKYVGYTTISYKKLERMFGHNGFNKLNKKLKIFRVTKYRWHEDNKKSGYTKGYQLTNKVAQIKLDYLNSENTEPSCILRSNGKRMLTPPMPIASRGASNRIVNQWNNEAFNALVPVNTTKLIEVREKLYSFLDKYFWTLADIDVVASLVAAYNAPRNIWHTINLINQILKLANNDIEKGSVIHTYKQCSTGRLFAQGITIQSTPRLIKHGALDGLWEYDFVNCHYAIFNQLANKEDIECTAIGTYLRTTKTTRERIAEDVGIEIDEAKECLLAILYGANSFEWKDASIPTLIGPDKSKALIKHPDYSAIHKDIHAGRKPILKRWPVKRSQYMNAMNITIQDSESAKRILAHLIQGIETKMLNTVFHAYPGELILLQHDGFASKSKLNKGDIEQLVKDKTGFDMRVKEWRIGTGTSRYNAEMKFLKEVLKAQDAEMRFLRDALSKAS